MNVQELALRQIRATANLHIARNPSDIDDVEILRSYANLMRAVLQDIVLDCNDAIDPVSPFVVMPVRSTEVAS